MCVTCGCGGDSNHTHEHHHSHHHSSDHHHEHTHVINLEAEILAENNQFATKPSFFKDKKSLALNFVSSPLGQNYLV